MDDRIVQPTHEYPDNGDKEALKKRKNQLEAQGVEGVEVPPADETIPSEGSTYPQ